MALFVEHPLKTAKRKNGNNFMANDRLSLAGLIRNNEAEGIK